jgi:putative methyltransferase (TIGR04325 family)
MGIKDNKLRFKKKKFDNTLLIKNAYRKTDFTDYIFEKCKEFFERSKNDIEVSYSDYRFLIPFAFDQSPKMTILDFGGGGNTFSLINRFFPGRIEKWIVVETFEMVSSSKNSYSTRLKFVDNCKNLHPDDTNIDLIICSSSLQYCEDPNSTLLDLVDLGAKYIWITRTLISKEAIAGILQRSSIKKNGPQIEIDHVFDEEGLAKVEYLMTPVPEILIESCLSEKYTEVLRCQEEPGMFKIDREEFAQWGILFRLRDRG